MEQNFDYSPSKISFFSVIVKLKKRKTWSQNSLYVQENIVTEDGFEESAVKWSVHLIMKYLLVEFFQKTFSHILQQAQQTEILSTMMEMTIFKNKNLTYLFKLCLLHNSG